ncbi:HNH endonuclease signature motif containing protein [Fibrobacter sp.]|uniref:HNH endonuclease n=1 Tax=Fibrobacter sp. TaxID=35828 RepID=UPI0025C48F1D|nr:HNH endonuclease signature motif containing protein [Fibrobacter sp.]
MPAINKKTRKIVYEKYGGRCAYCGQPIEMKDMQVDHIVPIARGHSDALMKADNMERGTENIDNYNPACRACNFRKGMLDIEEFREALMHGIDVLERNFTYRLMMRYGLIVEREPRTIKFFFEVLR